MPLSLVHYISFKQLADGPKRRQVGALQKGFAAVRAERPAFPGQREAHFYSNVQWTINNLPY